MQPDISFKKHVKQDYFHVAPGVWGLKNIFVNLYMVMNPYDGNWVLIDTGVWRSHKKIKKMAKNLFGEPGHPSSIILTHGHFDHTGAVAQLANEWNVPVFAHFLELPFLTGKSHYPPPDWRAGGGLVSLLSFTYPDSPIDLTGRIQSLPQNKRVPGLPEWKYIHTPGHAPGHISLFRDTDRVLIAGDAFITTKGESLVAVLASRKKLSGPPRYFTYDWALAKESVKRLAELEPEIAATGHGVVMEGSELRKALNHLSVHFYGLAVPQQGRYVNDPAVTNAKGVMYIPPAAHPVKALSTVILLVALTGIFVLLNTKRTKRKKNKAALAYEIW